MNRNELVEDLASRAGLTRREAREVLTSLTDEITECLSSGGKVELSGLGTFSVKEVNARQGRNPATGQTLVIPAHRKVSFRAAKRLREATQKP